MSLTIYSTGAYAAYGRDCYAWRQQDYNVNKFVKALKGDAFNGYAMIKDVAGVDHRLQNSTAAEAFEIFGGWARLRVNHLGLANAKLVPVPSSSCTEFGQNFTGAKMATAVSAENAYPILAFKNPMAKAHQGGEGGRNRQVIKANLKCSQRRLAGPIVLIDDVLTTGAHLRACAEFLRDLGADVSVGICAARSVWHQVENAWQVEPEDIEDMGFNIIG